MGVIWTNGGSKNGRIVLALFLYGEMMSLYLFAPERLWRNVATKI